MVDLHNICRILIEDCHELLKKVGKSEKAINNTNLNIFTRGNLMTEEMMEEITNRIIDKLNGCVKGWENESN